MKANYIVRFHGKQIKARIKRRKRECINHISFQRKQSESHTKDTTDYNIFGDIQKSTELERKTILSYVMY